MTHEKARDFFSAYQEGSLDPALRLSFEQKLSGDAGLRSEYDRFASTLEHLGALRETTIEVPFDLNERIAARLDRHIWEQKQATPNAWYGRLRLVAFGGLAAILLVGAGISLKNRDKSQASFATVGFVPQSGSGGDQLTVGFKQDQLTVEFSPQTRSTVVFRTEPDLKPFAEVTVDKTMPMTRPLVNKNPETDLVSIEVRDNPKVEQILIAIPGVGAEKPKSGSGTLEEFAKVLAAKYRIPVALNGIKDPLVQITWTLDAPDARRAADAALKGQYIVDTRDESNLVTISQG